MWMVEHINHKVKVLEVLVIHRRDEIPPSWQYEHIVHARHRKDLLDIVHLGVGSAPVVVDSDCLGDELLDLIVGPDEGIAEGGSQGRHGEVEPEEKVLPDAGLEGEDVECLACLEEDVSINVSQRCGRTDSAEAEDVLDRQLGEDFIKKNVQRCLEDIRSRAFQVKPLAKQGRKDWIECLHYRVLNGRESGDGCLHRGNDK